MNKRIFPRNKAVIFILNILLISVIVGLFSSIISGIGTRQFYVNADNNVVTIVDPTVRTPAVSYIPKSISTIFEDMKGVTIVSPEIYSLVLVDNKPATLHGITGNFTKLVSVKAVSGVSFTNITEQELSLGIFAGQSIANELGLKIGSNYLIYSTIADSFVSFKLLGIVQFNSFYNEELFTSLQNSNFFRPTSEKNDVSMIRIKYNPEILSTTKIYGMINNYHTVTIQLQNPPAFNGNLNGISVNVVTVDGFLMSSTVTDSNGQTTVNLPLGDYVFLVTYGSTAQSFEKLIYNSTTITYTLESGYNSSPQSGGNLTVTAYNNGLEVSDAKLIVIDEYGNQQNLNFESNYYVIENLAKGTYTLKATWNNEKDNQEINFQSSTNLTINFTHKVKINLKTAKDISLTTFSCSIYNYNNQTNIIKNDCTQPFYLPKSVYNVSVTNTIYGSESQVLVVTDSSTLEQYNFTVGNIQTNLTVYTSNGVFYSDKPVYSRGLTSNSYFFEGNTSEQGTITLSFPYDSEHVLYFNSLTTKNQIYYKSLVNENKTIILDTTRQLTIYTYNGSVGESSPLNGVKIEIKTLNNTIYTKTSPINGYSTFNIETEDILNATLTFGQYSKNFLINSFTTGDSLNFPLGKNHISIVAKNDFGAPVNNVNITYISDNGNQTYRTSSKGTDELYLNTPNNPTLLEQSGDMMTTSTITDNLQLLFLKQNYYVFEIQYNKITHEILIPKTYFSSSVNTTTLTPYIFIASIQIINAVNQGIANVVLKMTSQVTRTTMTVVTDGSGTGTIQLPSDGVYNIVINDNGKQFTYALTTFVDKTTYSIQILIFGSNVNIINNIRGSYLALTSKQYQENFYNTTTTFFIQLALILLLVVVIILIFLFSSAILLTFESIQKEIAVVQIIGGTNIQITWNLLAQLSLRALGASVIGYFIGYIATIVFPSLKEVQLVGFIINPAFNPIIFIISIVTVNILSVITLLRQLGKFNWKLPLMNIRF